MKEYCLLSAMVLTTCALSIFGNRFDKSKGDGVIEEEVAKTTCTYILWYLGGWATT